MKDWNIAVELIFNFFKRAQATFGGPSERRRGEETWGSGRARSARGSRQPGGRQPAEGQAEQKGRHVDAADPAQVMRNAWHDFHVLLILSGFLQIQTPCSACSFCPLQRNSGATHVTRLSSIPRQPSSQGRSLCPTPLMRQPIPATEFYAQPRVPCKLCINKVNIFTWYEMQLPNSHEARGTHRPAGNRAHSAQPRSTPSAKTRRWWPQLLFHQLYWKYTLPLKHRKLNGLQMSSNMEGVPEGYQIKSQPVENKSHGLKCSAFWTSTRLRAQAGTRRQSLENRGLLWTERKS